MSIFLTLFSNLLPLYALIAMGYIAGRYMGVDRQSLGTVGLYIFSPVVFVGFIADMEFKSSYIALPFIIFILEIFVLYFFLILSRKIYGRSDPHANLISMCAAMGNTGYFGLPLAMLFFSKELVAIYIFMNLGVVVFEATIGYYIAARGNFDMRTSLIKLSRFPSIYAIALGFIFNISEITLPEQFWTYWTYFKGAYIVVGMMVVGAALSTITHFVLGPRFLSLVFTGKFLMWPALAFAFSMLDKTYLNWFSSDIHALMMIIALVPPGANIATLATKMNLEPEKAATTILIGTIFALFYIPLMVWVLGIS